MDAKTLEAIIEQAIQSIDDLAAPANMTKGEAAEFYEAVGSHCEGFTAMITEELKAEAEG